MVERLENLLREFGYRVVEDAWIEQGRKTYINSEDADRAFVKDLERALLALSWKKHATVLRAFQNARNGETLEIEISGPDTSGHFLHLHKAA